MSDRDKVLKCFDVKELGRVDASAVSFVAKMPTLRRF